MHSSSKIIMMYVARICVSLMIVIKVVYAQSDIETARVICPALRKLPRPFNWTDASIAAINNHMFGMKDMLWRIVRMPDYYNQFDASQNFCNIFQFGPDCKSNQCFPKVTTNAREGSTAGVCFTYNARTENTVRMELEYEKIDDKFAIQSNKITKIEHIDTRSGHVTNQFVNGIPTNVAVAQDLYTYVAVQPQGYWSIMQSCDERVTWVRLLVPFLNYDETSPMLYELLNLNQLEQEVNKKLQDLGIDSLNLAPVPLVSPFPPLPMGSSFNPLAIVPSSFAPQASAPVQPPQPMPSSYTSQPSITPYSSQHASSPFPPQQGTSPYSSQQGISPYPSQQGASSFLSQPLPPPLPYQRGMLPFPGQSTNPFDIEPVMQPANPFLYQPVAQPISSQPTMTPLPQPGITSTPSPSMTSPFRSLPPAPSSPPPPAQSPPPPAAPSSPPQSMSPPALRTPVTGTFNPRPTNGTSNLYPDMISFDK